LITRISSYRLDWKSGSTSTPILIEGKVQSVIDKSLLDKMEIVLFHRSKKQELQRQMNVHNDHIKKIFENQSRLRDNIKSLEKILDSDLVRRYLKDLNRQEDDLNSTRKNITELVEEEAQINEQIKHLNLEISTITKKEIEILTNKKKTMFDYENESETQPVAYDIDIDDDMISNKTEEVRVKRKKEARK